MAMQEHFENQKRMQEITAAQWLAAATLAASIVGASNRPHSVDEAFEVTKSCFFKMFPSKGSGAYEAWAASDASSKLHE
jgi:hypothetical protein